MIVRISEFLFQINGAQKMYYIQTEHIHELSQGRIHNVRKIHLFIICFDVKMRKKRKNMCVEAGAYNLVFGITFDADWNSDQR